MNAASNGLWVIVIKECLFNNTNAIAVLVKGNPEEAANYRPVNLISVVCKALESILNRAILSFLSQYKA